ncbi:MAG: NHL repeat-containing protein [Chloroflexota bacterium]
MSRILRFSAISIVLTLVALALLTSVALAAPGDVTADKVFGQGGSFTTQGCGLTASALCSPSGVAVDPAGNVYIADSANNRVLEYNTPLTSDFVADRVFGQSGSFTSKVCNLGGITASSLCLPTDVAVDSAGDLFVVDFNNNRVLEYLTPTTSDTVADQVFGQANNFTTDTFIGFPFNTSATPDTLANPISVAIDSTGHLYIGDRGFHRVLEYDPPLTNTTADRVFGQLGSFSTGGFNQGGISANSLGDFNGIGVDSAGDLFVADSNNSRALEYKTPLTTDTTADVVFGQYGSFTSSTPNLGGVSADSLESPTDIGADSAGNVYITDTGPERTLIYDNPSAYGTTADVVFGQGGNFSAFGNNSGGVSASSQADPWAIAFDGTCDLYVVEYGNNRVSEYDQPPHACVIATGTPGPTSSPPAPTPTPSPTPVSTGCNPALPIPCTPTPVPTPTPTPTPTPPPLSPLPNTPTPTVGATTPPATGPVGGVSELLVSDGSSTSSPGRVAIVFVVIAMAVAVTVAAWYVGRRLRDIN